MRARKAKNRRFAAGLWFGPTLLDDLDKLIELITGSALSVSDCVHTLGDVDECAVIILQRSSQGLEGTGPLGVTGRFEHSDEHADPLGW
jgi:hypothetical protein